MTEERRLAAILHIVHDYTLLVSADEEIHRHPPAPLNSHVQYSFLLQCRKFGVFFADKPPVHKEDIISSDFLGERIHFNLSEWTRWYDHMNVHLFHLSYERINNTRPWTGFQGLNRRIFDQFRTAWRMFRAKVEEPYRAEFERQIFLKKQPNEYGPSEFQALDLD